MWREILNIDPKLDNGDLNEMERRLSTRFTKVAKKFSKGLAGAIAGGGIAGLAMGLIEKVLNPLKETQEAMDKFIAGADDLATNAEHFNTTAGKLVKLRALATSTGLDEESLYMLMNKFKTAVAEASQDPTKDSAVRAYVGQKDTAEGFFNFIQSLKEMDDTSKTLIQTEVFGEKQILKMADFLQTDMASQLRKIGARSSDEYDKDIHNLAEMKDLADILQARRDLKDLRVKGQTMTGAMITSRDQQIKNELGRENQRIANYHTLAKTQETMNELVYTAEKGLTELAKAVFKLGDIQGMIKQFQTLRGIKGMLGFGGDK